MVASACAVVGTGNTGSRRHCFQVENRLWHTAHRGSRWCFWAPLVKTGPLPWAPKGRALPPLWNRRTCAVSMAGVGDPTRRWSPCQTGVSTRPSLSVGRGPAWPSCLCSSSRAYSFEAQTAPASPPPGTLITEATWQVLRSPQGRAFQLHFLYQGLLLGSQATAYRPCHSEASFDECLMVVDVLWPPFFPQLKICALMNL